MTSKHSSAVSCRDNVEVETFITNEVFGKLNFYTLPLKCNPNVFLSI